MIRKMPDSLIVVTLGRLLIPLTQLFGLYVLFFGQYGPGGGFVGGVILGASVIVSILIFGLGDASGKKSRMVRYGDGLGLLLFVGVGGFCLIGGGEFLHYADMNLPGLEPAARRYLGILMTQIGVAVDVAVTAVSIVLSLSGTHDDEDAHV